MEEWKWTRSCFQYCLVPILSYSTFLGILALELVAVVAKWLLQLQPSLLHMTASKMGSKRDNGKGNFLHESLLFWRKVLPRILLMSLIGHNWILAMYRLITSYRSEQSQILCRWAHWCLNKPGVLLVKRVGWLLHKQPPDASSETSKTNSLHN